MISNFHQSSGPYEASSSYYTFDEPSPKTKSKKTKKKGRIFGLGKKHKKSNELGDWRPPQHLDDNSTLTGQSLTYSTSAASHQTTGESTNSSGGAFGEILQMLDEEDRREMLEKRKLGSDRSMYSTTSSLAYSEGTTTFDGDQSYLEGTKLLGMLSDEPELQPLRGTNYVSPNKTPLADNKTSRKNRQDNACSGNRDHSLTRQERATMVEDEDPVSSSSSSSSPWLCGIDLADAGAALRPFLCF